MFDNLISYSVANPNSTLSSLITALGAKREKTPYWMYYSTTLLKICMRLFTNGLFRKVLVAPQCQPFIFFDIKNKVWSSLLPIKRTKQAILLQCTQSINLKSRSIFRNATICYEVFARSFSHDINANSCCICKNIHS